VRSKLYVSLGSNEGERLLNLVRAVKLLKEKVRVLAYSSVYLTEAVGFEGRDFLNMCLLLSTDMDPFESLNFFQEVERKLGRTSKGKPYKDRIIDIDILLWENLTVVSPTLIIPHPEIRKRDFVNIPLLELFSMGYSDLGYSPKIVGNKRVLKVIQAEALKFD
jgi:2-amino-4-hydroxy-6-hydroxymethyldihydropteridine diphosphokinase